jgi:hypothetical protein
MGYRNVILYGVDVKAGYFWENGGSEGIHTGSRGRVRVDEIIPWIRTEVFLPENRGIFLGSSSSLLFPELPLWKQEVVHT